MAQPPGHKGWEARAAASGLSLSGGGTRAPPRDPLSSIDGVDDTISNNTWSGGRNGPPRPTAADNDLDGASSTAAKRGSGEHDTSITLRCSLSLMALFYAKRSSTPHRRNSTGTLLCRCCYSPLQCCGLPVSSELPPNRSVDDATFCPHDIRTSTSNCYL